MRWGRKDDESIASNEVARRTATRIEGGAHADTTRIDYADRESRRAR